MLISGILAIMIMGGAITTLIAAAVILAILDSHYDSGRRHWRPAESSTH